MRRSVGLARFCICLRRVGALVGEQPLFAMEAAAVAGERAVGADDAMAGHDDADGIGTIRETDGADGAGTADALGPAGRS